MRIAIFSDIHANLPALQAFFQDLEIQKPDAVYCLGDLVGYNIWPNEVVHEIQKRGIPTIAGNYDQGIGLHIDECGCAYKTEEDKAMGKISISYTNEIVGAEERKYLRNLPSQIRVEFVLNEHKFSLLLVHGSPRKINEYLFEDREESSMIRIMEQSDADILCFGHTHKPYHRILQTENESGVRYRHAINTGSVGKPKDGDNRGGYVIIELDEHSSVYQKESISVAFIRFEYDVESAAKAVENSPLPDAYADMLRKAY
ncbi:MAG: hypothetical protein RIR96_1417 [Bacteroidota bacterium]|jgi:putative phosphoesterase